MSEYFVGLMSGTSLDGIDAALAVRRGGRLELVGTFYAPYPATLRAELLDLHYPGQDELHRVAQVANELSERYAEAVRQLLIEHTTQPEEVRAIGCHGQTIRHRPEAGYTVQIVNGALLAEKTGITTVVDFRSRDIAAGGQGAPLVPAFHRAMFSHPHESRVVVNIGGIANITYLPVEGSVLGFDCGPGNVLMDLWCERSTGAGFDEGGRWAAGGTVVPELLERWLTNPFFDLPPPKSAGRDTFELDWILANGAADYAPRDVQCTLVQLTVEGISQAIERYCPATKGVYLCGGGARNDFLREQLTARLKGMVVGCTDEIGVNADWLEAYAFAWLAECALNTQTANLPEVTGAAGPRVLGAIYPA